MERPSFIVDVESMSKGLAYKFSEEEISSIGRELVVPLRNCVAATIQELGDESQALDRVIMTARICLEQAERLREIYLNGMH